MSTLRRYWYTVSQTQDGQHQLLSTEVPALDAIRSVNSSGLVLYLVCGSQRQPTHVWAYNWLERNVRPCAKMPVPVVFKSSGMVGNRLYVTGWPYDDKRMFQIKDRELQTYSLNINSQTWEPTPLFVEPSQEGPCLTTRITSVDNILVGYDMNFGLMWYDELVNHWKKVLDLNSFSAKSVAVSEYNGKVVVIWTKLGDNGVTKILYWTTIKVEMITGGLRGVADPSFIVAEIPQEYEFRFFVSMFG
ncbi:F-box/kelch-repeat protein At2g44700-like isoform X1 [Capsella rubella]|uniref:F-box/kelch-repeat protein At2g44700-like isoform X1 n=1 Tax=Capsella rubella TaxID=81985 RepID=UPI000CD50BD1|nr:F-box/kelch-repeat protein At2g44700-like isoform X1 [Capsella rubella]